MLQAQLEASPDDWPEQFTFPQPQEGLERQAFEGFLAKARGAGLPVDPVEFTSPGKPDSAVALESGFPD